VDLGRERAPALTSRAGPQRASLALAATAAALTLAAPAQAATVSVEGNFLRILSASGETNALTVTETGGSFTVTETGGSVTVTDAGAPLTAGPGCAPSDIGVTCVTPADPSIDVSASDGDDSVTVDAAAPAFVDGGPGDDLIDVQNGLSDTAWCGRGHDSVGADVLDFLDLGCEQVDYGPAGSVGRPAWRAGGGRWVEIPGQTWGRVDRRILPDVLYLVRRYHVRIDEGYGTVGHEPFGEHPLGLAVDIVPGAGGTWDDVSRLARWAEPRQNHPRAPFRWVGWNGDVNHGHPSVCKPRLGCAPHLHLSWSHSPAPPRHIARRVRVFEVRGVAP
jgi:hypothetical protein